MPALAGTDSELSETRGGRGEVKREGRKRRKATERAPLPPETSETLPPKRGGEPVPIGIPGEPTTNKKRSLLSSVLPWGGGDEYKKLSLVLTGITNKDKNLKPMPTSTRESYVLGGGEAKPTPPQNHLRRRPGSTLESSWRRARGGWVEASLQ